MGRFDDDGSQVRPRPSRPGFAEDVYGSGRGAAANSICVTGVQQARDYGGGQSELCGSALAQRRSANLPKLKELSAGGSSDLNISSMECPLASARANQMGELEFVYADADTFRAELAELYTYSEIDEFALNHNSFLNFMRVRQQESTWTEVPHREKCKLIQELVGSLENADPERRLEACRVILYILQGAYGDFAEMESQNGIGRSGSERNKEEEENVDNDENGLYTPDRWFGQENGTGGFESDCLLRAAVNSYFLYEQGLFQPLCSLFFLETSTPFERHADQSRQSSVSNSRSASHMDLAAGGDGPGSASGTFERRRSKRSATLADNERIRVVLNCIYHLVESLRREELIGQIGEMSGFSTKYSKEQLTALRSQFLMELDEPLEQSRAPLIMHLFDMLPTFVRGKTPHYPVKKILLLCWKVLLATQGGMDCLREEKTRKRREAELPLVEDTLQKAIRIKPVLNCGGGGIGGLLGLTTAPEADAAIMAQLGRKVRSIHQQARPFNRQVACSSNAGQDLETQEDGQEAEKAEPASEFEEVDDVMMPPGESTVEEAEQATDEENDNLQSEKLIEQGLGELSCSVISNKDGPNDGTVGSDGEEATLEMAEEKETEPAQEQQPKITVTGEQGFQLYYKYPGRIATWGKSENNKDIDEMEKLLADEKRMKECGRGAATRQQQEGNDGGDQTPRASQSPVGKSSPWPPPPPPGLPWKPKVYELDIENFLQIERQKYFGYELEKDSTTIFGLPEPVHRSMAALRRNIYTSLSDLQLKSEDRYNRFPFSQREFIEDTRTERLYARMLPSMTEYVIALLKVILASLPSSKAKIDAVTILSDVLTPETDTNEILSNSISLDFSNQSHNVLEETVRVAIDINRHKELIIKAASSIIILLLKHFRLNHTYQFENLAQYLVLANCLPLILKFLDQNICRYFQSRHELAPFNYPQCALYFVRNGSEWPQLTAENVDDGESPSYFLWRNVFSSINLIRVINKLTKGKQARTVMLVVYKSAPVLKRCMRAKLGIFQLYVLKLLKMQARYLGRQWRKTNMDLISAIYMRVRHRLNDDWAYANETTRTKSFDIQRDEHELGMAIKRFNKRRYPHIVKDAEQHQGNGPDSQEEQSEKLNSVEDRNSREWEPLDNSLQSALAWEPQFSERFTLNYEQWLEEEVFQRRTDWDILLRNSRGLLDLYC